MATRFRWATLAALVRAVRGTLRPGEPGMGERLRAVPRLATATLRGRYHGTTRGRLGLMALGVLYVLSPVDLLPDVLPLIGVADDAVVVLWLAGALLADTGDFLAWERDAPGRSRSWFGRRTAFEKDMPDVVPGHVVR